MNTTYIDMPHAEILANITAAVSEAAGFALVVRVSEEAQAHRNVGIDLPRIYKKGGAHLLRCA